MALLTPHVRVVRKEKGVQHCGLGMALWIKELESETKLGQQINQSCLWNGGSNMGSFIYSTIGNTLSTVTFGQFPQTSWGEWTSIQSALCSCALDYLWPESFLSDKPGLLSIRSLCFGIWESLANSRNWWLWEHSKLESDVRSDKVLCVLFLLSVVDAQPLQWA